MVGKKEKTFQVKVLPGGAQLDTKDMSSLYCCHRDQYTNQQRSRCCFQPSFEITI